MHAMGGRMNHWAIPVLLLSSCWALSFAVLTSGAAASNLAAASLTSVATLTSFPLAFTTFTSGLYNLILPFEIEWLGRYRAYLLGALVGLAGCLVCWAGMVVQSLALLLIGCLAIGVGLSHSQNYRFGVLQCVPQQHHPVAISWVLAGGVAGAVLGPEYSKHTRNVIEGVPFGGIYLVSAGCFGLLMVLLVIGAPALRPLMKQVGGGRASSPPRATSEASEGTAKALAAAQAQDVAEGAGTNTGQGALPMRRLVTIYAEPRTLAATLVAALAYGSMVFTMSGVPLAMATSQDGAAAPLFSFQQSSLVVQLHMVSMFAPSFITGHLIRKFGVPAVQYGGALVLCIGSVLCLTVPKTLFANYASGQSAVGLGWNWCFIAATSDLQHALRPTERMRVQALNDLIVFSCAGTGSLLSGVALRNIGWAGMNYVAIGIAVTIVLVVFVANILARKQAARSNDDALAEKSGRDEKWCAEEGV